MKSNKNIITVQDYINAENHYLDLPDDGIRQLAESSAAEQPALFIFVAVYYDGLTDIDNKEFYLQLIYSIWIAYNNKYKRLRQLNLDEIEKMDEEEEKKLVGIAGNEAAMTEEVVKRMFQHPQAELIGYMYELIGDFFQLDKQDEESPDTSINDAGIISSALIMVINLMEKSREHLIVS